MENFSVSLPTMESVSSETLRGTAALLKRPLFITKREHLDLRLEGEKAFLATSPEQGSLQDPLDLRSKWTVWYYWRPDRSSKEDLWRSLPGKEEVKEEIKRSPPGKKQRI